jgi:nucleotide-binding universal stress UspA family protein
MKTILCSVDFSTFSSAVLHFGSGLARQFGCRLFIFHAVYSANDQIYGTTLFEQGGEQKERIADALAKIQALMKECPIEWEPLVRVGEPVETLAQAARDADVDIVVAASHGLGGLKRMLLGRVIERMARMVNKPLLVVRGQKALRQPEVHFAPLLLKRILIGCSPTSHFQPALEWGSRIARGFGGTLIVLHAMESPASEDPPDSAEAPYTQIEQERQDRLRGRLEALIPKHDRLEPAVEFVLAPGVPADAMLAHSQQKSSDLIVVGVRRQSGIRRVLIGSTTEAVLRHAPCPVLVVPESGQA